jgi:SulP family sulfate permease
MAERTAFATLLRSSPGDAVVLLATFGLTVFRGLTEGIVVGFALGALLFIHRMAQHAGVEVHAPPVPEDQADTAGAARLPYDPSIATDPDVAVYRITGAFFFGAAATVGSVLERIADQHRAFVIDFSAVPFIDSTAANTMGGIARKAARHHVVLLISGATPAVRKSLTTHGVSAPTVLYERTVEAAISAAHAEIARRASPDVSAPA